MKLRAILFDLFGTVVQFQPRVPTIQVAGTQWRSTMAWLRPMAQELLPQVAFNDLLAALLQATEEIVRARPPEYLEVSSPRRFQIALERLSIRGPHAEEIAARLSLAHMDHIASLTFLPDGHLELLRQLRSSYRIGLISNFDHGPTAHRILEQCGVQDLFDPPLISDDFGRRKPHPAIFEHALDHMGVKKEDAIFVGDSLDDDVAGARNAGMRSVWIRSKNEEVPLAGPIPDLTITQLTELREHV